MRYSMLLILCPLLAYASPNQEASPLSMVPMTLTFIGLFYFLIIRPQKKQKNEQQTMQQKLDKGDEVLLSNGVIGLVAHADEQIIRVKVSSSQTLQVMRSHIHKILPKGTFKD